MDINMPGLNGIDATRRILDESQRRPRARDDDARRRRGRVRRHPRRRARLPAEGRGPGRDAPRDPVGRERRGDLRPGDRRPAAALPCRAAAADPSQAFPQLTDRELEILQLLAERRTNAEIAAELFLSQKTVRNYVSAIFAKLQVADRAEAGLVARAAGLGDPPPREPVDLPPPGTRGTSSASVRWRGG